MSKPLIKETVARISARRGWCVTLALLGSVALLGNAVQAAWLSIDVEYEAIDLGVFPGDESSYATDVNVFEQIVGVSARSEHSRAVIWAHTARVHVATWALH